MIAAATVAVLPVCLLALVCTSCAERSPAFPVEAKVAMRDGSSIEITDFALIGRRSFEPVGGYEVRHLTLDADVPIHIFGNGWRELPISRIASMALEPIQATGGSWEWFRASISTKAGEQLAGRIPVSPDNTWHNARRFVVRGRSVVLGSDAAFEIPLRELRKIEVKDESTWMLTDDKGDTRDVREPRFGAFWNAPLQRRRCSWNRTGYSPFLDVNVGGTKTSLPVDSIERLRLTRPQVPPSVHILTRDKREMSAQLDDYTFLFGRTREGGVWFGPLLQAREIEFAAPSRRR